MGNIRVIGPRGSGKTTYLAGLAYWPTEQNQAGKKSRFAIQPLNQETTKLAENAENIIMDGKSLEPTITHVRNIYDLPSYSFKIEINKRLGEPEELILAVRDHPGEMFDNLGNGIKDSLHSEFLEECLGGDVAGCLVLLTDWGSKADRHYKRVFNQFANLLEKYDRTHDLRLAITMSKCERGEIWPGRIDPEIDLFNLHLPETYRTLCAKVPEKNRRFFALSTFGVLDRNDPRPNRVEQWGTDGSSAVLRKEKKWKPFNMIEPLYWLSTGKRL